MQLSEITFTNITLDIFSACIVLCLLLSCIFGQHRKGITYHYILLLLIFAFFQALQDSAIMILTRKDYLHTIRFFNTNLIVISGYATVTVFACYLYYGFLPQGKLWNKLLRINMLLCVFFSVCSLILSYCKLSFYYDAEGVLQRGRYWLLLFVYPIVALIFDLVAVLYTEMKKEKKRLYIFYCLFPIVVLIFGQFLYGFVFVEITSLFFVLLVYVNSYLEQERDLLEIEAQLTNSKMETMMSQIQPHFLYNTISSAMYLCDVDPQLAKETMGNFGKYLRSNLDSLKLSVPIPFQKELEHIDIYLKLEHARFGDKLNVEYDIGTEDFVLPSLSVQPLVENAVKYGITENQGRGRVRLSTYEDEKYFYVIVEDNGKGFDTKSLEGDNKVHIGINNIRSRLENMVGGSLLIESQIGKGTVATIKIPKKREERNARGG